MPYFFETEEHAQLRESARRFAHKHIAPNAHAWEEACDFPRELCKTASESGLLGISYPTEDGGGGGNVAHALVGECAARVARGEQVPGLSAMTKNTATDMCSFVVDQAVQIHGGNGYMREYLVERLYRDARLYSDRRRHARDHERDHLQDRGALTEP